MKNHCTLQYHKGSMEILRGFVKDQGIALVDKELH